MPNTSDELPEPKEIFLIQVYWNSLSSKCRLELQEKLNVSRSTLWAYRNDPEKIPLGKAIEICQYFLIENPRDLIRDAHKDF